MSVLSLDSIYEGNKSTLNFCMYKVKKITDRENIEEEDSYSLTTQNNMLCLHMQYVQYLAFFITKYLSNSILKFFRMQLNTII